MGESGSLPSRVGLRPAAGRIVGPVSDAATPHDARRPTCRILQ
jgi:hypothetical protein